jgi:hypothetical protein
MGRLGKSVFDHERCRPILRAFPEHEGQETVCPAANHRTAGL